MRHRLGAAAGAAVILLVAAACTSGTGTGPSTASDPVPSTASAPMTSTSTAATSRVSTSAVAPSSTDATSASAAPTSSLPPTTPTSTPTEIAEAQVKAFVPTYFAALDRLAASLTLPLTELDNYAVNPVKHERTLPMEGYRANGWIGVGTTKVGPVKVTSVDLSATPPIMKVSTCIDVRDSKEIDKATGRTVTVPDRPDFFLEHLSVVNVDHLAATGWRISDETNAGVKSCGAA